jgi:hypothetical protein
MKKMITLLLISLSIGTLAKENYKLPNKEIPKKIKNKLAPLTDWICVDQASDSAKAYAIYYWITHHIEGDSKSFNKQSKLVFRKPAEILKRRKAVSEEYAYLTQAMMHSQHIMCQVIFGYEKNELYEDGAGFYHPNHAWNAVWVAQQWQPIDASNGAGDFGMALNWMKSKMQKVNKDKLYTSSKIKFNYDFKPEYFLQDVEELRLTRLPVDPVWQLTDSAMPIALFEGSEEGIRYFNEHYSRPAQNQSRLYDLNQLNENEAILEAADRTYAFNPRYTSLKAEKHFALAQESLKKLKGKKDYDYVREEAEKAKSELSASKDILNQQKAEIGKEYDELRKVNSEKRSDVIRYKKNFTDMNRKFILKAKTEIQQAEQKKNTLRNENELKRKKLNEPYKLNTNQSGSGKQVNEVTRLLDSVSKRKALIYQINEEISVSTQENDWDRKLQSSLIDSLNLAFRKTDTALKKEAVARSKKQDSFDDSVRVIRKAVFTYKNQGVDNFQQLYFDLYDSIQQRFETNTSKYQLIQDKAQLNAKNIEAAIQAGADQKEIQFTIDELQKIKKQSLEGLIQNNEQYQQYLTSHIHLFTQMKKIYEDENKYFDYLTKTEDDRKDYVKNLLDKAEEIDQKHNEQRKDIVKTMKNNVDASLKTSKKRRRR